MNIQKDKSSGKINRTMVASKPNQYLASNCPKIKLKPNHANSQIILTKILFEQITKNDQICIKGAFQYNENRISQLFDVAEDISIRKMFLHDCVSLFKIPSINFSRLITLSLVRNQIFVLQSFQLCSFQNLKSLSLAVTKVINIRSLRKLNTPQIQSLVVCFPRIQDEFISIEDLSEFHAPNLKNMFFDVTYPDSFYKIESKNFQIIGVLHLCMTYRGRNVWMRNTKKGCYDTLKKKHPNIKIRP